MEVATLSGYRKLGIDDVAVLCKFKGRIVRKVCPCALFTSEGLGVSHFPELISLFYQEILVVLLYNFLFS